MGKLQVMARAVVCVMMLAAGCNVATQTADDGGGGLPAGDGGSVYKNLCDEYAGRVFDCIDALCADKSCSVCDSLERPIAEYRTNGYSGTCEGENLATATAGLKDFSCLSDTTVASVREAIQGQCTPTIACAKPGDVCFGGRCIESGGFIQCLRACTVAGDSCASGFCYMMDLNQELYCAPGGTSATGEVCSEGNDCSAGGQCLSAEGAGLTCWRVCTSDADCPVGTCTDTGYGFNVCFDDGSCAYEGQGCAGTACCGGLFCNGARICQGGGSCAGQYQSCVSHACCGGLTCDAGRVCQPIGACMSLGTDCEVDEDCCGYGGAVIGAWCNEEGKCASCSAKSGECATDYDCCPSMTPLMCTTAGLCERICDRDADCPAPQDCMANGECLPPACSSDAACNGKRCCGGACKDDCGYGTPTACAITTQGGVIHKGQSVQLNAVAYSGNPATGGQAVPWTAFNWASTDNTRATVDAAGRVTGGDAYGQADISATAGALDCGKVRFTNYLPESAGRVRVLVVDERTGTPIQNADVVIGANAPVKTDAEGLVVLNATAGDVHVFHNSYAFVSVMGTARNDLIIHLPPKPDSARVGGYKGTFDFSREKDRALQIGCASTSLTLNSFDGDLYEHLYGEPILTHLTFETAKGAPTDFDDWMLISSGSVTRADQFGAPDFIPNYRVQGEPGLRAAWGIGGGLPSKDITKIIQIIAPIIGGGGDVPMGQMLAAWSPFLAKFSHAVQPVFNVVPIAKITTPLAGNGNPLVDTPTMADYARFPTLNLGLETRMALKTVLTLPKLPRFQGRCLGEAMALGGTHIPDMGITPLGYVTVLDNPDDPRIEGDCKANAPMENPEGLPDGKVLLRLSPAHGGLETNRYVIIVIAFDTNSTATSDTGGFAPSLEGQAAISVRLTADSTVGPTYDLSSTAFLEFPEGAAFDQAARRINGPTLPVTGASFYRYKVANDKGEWHVYTASVGAAISLPAVPAGVENRTIQARMSVNALSLAAGYSLDKLVSADGGQHLNGLLEVIDGFSRITCLHKITPADPDYEAKCQPTDPTQVDEACNPACEVR